MLRSKVCVGLEHGGCELSEECLYKTNFAIYGKWRIWCTYYTPQQLLLTQINTFKTLIFNAQCILWLYDQINIWILDFS